MSAGPVSAYLFDSVVASNLKLEQPVFFPRSIADVMNDERPPKCVGSVAHDHDMRKILGHSAGNKVTGPIVAGILRYWEVITHPLEVGLKVGDASVVNVFIWTLESPVLGIAREMALHVF